MAVRIPIVTVFDSKGLKTAQYELNKVRGSFQNLGRNFAIAGAALAGGVALIGRSLRDAADSQRVFAQTESVLKSTGTTANGTARDIQNLAASLQKSTAFNDEAILSGANLLLTFKNIQNQAGETNDIFDQTVRASLDVARAMGTDASTEAIRLGKALNDPVRGISALTRVGIQFTDQQKEQIKTLTASGDLLGAQKIILAELQSQFGGSAAAYAQTFAGQVESLNNELNDLSEEIGFMVMPAVRDMVAAFREAAPEIGAKLKAAIAQVDWKAFAKGISDTTIFLAQNADTILKVVTALFTLNTAYNAIRAASGLVNAALSIISISLGKTAVAAGIATTAMTVLRTALLLSGIGAVLVVLGLIVDGITGASNAAEDGESKVRRFGSAVKASGDDADYAGGKFGIATSKVKGFNDEVAKIKTIDPRFGTNYNQGFRDRLTRQASGNLIPDLTDTIPDLPGPAAITERRQTFGQIVTKNVTAQVRQNKLVAAGLSEGAAQLALSTVNNKKQFQKLQATLSKPGVIEKRQAQFNRTAAGIAELRSIREANEAQAAQDRAAEQEAQRQRDAIIAAEKAAADERARIYQSFADSVANTFASIKDAIVGAFSLPELGGSTDSIIRNMDKLLARVRAFSTNISQLSTMGLNPTLLAQVIQAGPVAGARLAANLVAGGAEGLARINAGFGEIQTLGSDIGLTGTQSRFGTTQQQQIINVNINGGLDSSAAIGKAVVDAVRAYERTSGAVWQGA